MESLASQLNLSTRQLLALIGFLIILMTIPLASVLLKQSQVLKSRASELKSEKIATSSATLTKGKEIPASSPLSELQKLLKTTPGITPPNQQPPSSPANPTPTPNLAFGPILTVKISIEGRPSSRQSSKVFIGISSGNPTTKPTYLLSFSVDFPDSGTFSGLSLAGLNPGSTYTAYIKGPSQIDTATTFTMSPTETTLNSNLPVVLVSGDLNEDNTITTADYNIAKSLFGKTVSSSSWNERADINKDGIINSMDLGYITKNIGKTGASGLWTSPIPVTTPSTPSAQLDQIKPIGGYWLWVP